MTEKELTNIQAMRCTIKTRFEKGFREANTTEELLKVYAQYTGALEGILDTIECIEMAKKER